MTDILITLFGIIQLIGGVIGAGGSLLAEIFYVRAMRDGTVDAAERAHLAMVGHTLRFGMMLLLAGSIGLTLTAFVYENAPQPALSQSYWILMGLVFVIIFFSWALSRRQVGFTLASAAIFTAWWYVVLHLVGYVPTANFGEAVALFTVLTALVAGVVKYARVITTEKVIP